MFNEMICPGCGMTRNEWQGNGGRGYEQGGEIYCCDDCAEGLGCDCGGQEAEISAGSELELGARGFMPRRSPARRTPARRTPKITLRRKPSGKKFRRAA